MGWASVMAVFSVKCEATLYILRPLRAIEISLKFVLHLVNKFGEPPGWYSGTTTSRFGPLDDEVFLKT